MTSYLTNGAIVQLLFSAAANPTHPEYADADDYVKKFRSMESTFFAEVHSVTDVGLAMSEARIALAVGKVPNIYTFHGSKHIADLIASLDQLSLAIKQINPDYELTTLEAYILLCAAHVHDAANVEQREDHPSRCNVLIQRYKNLFASTATMQQIYDVARVHGGRDVEFGKDTIRDIQADNETKPRLTLLASLIRIGDELSENAERVPNEMLLQHEHSELSKLAHSYARSFTRFELRKETLCLVYNLYPDVRDLQVGENPSGYRTFLDFLEGKIDVIERECRYCSQYGRPALNISKISVTINSYVSALPSRIEKSVKFDLELIHGYPNAADPLCRRSVQLIERKVEHLSDCFVEPATDRNVQEDNNFWARMSARLRSLNKT